MVRIWAASAQATASAAQATAAIVIHRAGPLTDGLVAPNTPSPPSSVPMMVTVRTTRSVAVSTRSSDLAGVSSPARFAQTRSSSVTGRTRRPRRPGRLCGSDGPAGPAVASEVMAGTSRSR